MTKENFIKRYTKYEEQVQEYMNSFANAIEDKYKEIPDVFLVTLDIIAGNLQIMVKSMNAITSGDADIVGKDEYRGEKKSTELSAFLASQNNVSKLVDKFGFTPLGLAKLKDVKNQNEVKQVLENLLS